MDEDGNGLDDEVEAQIAACFAPEFRFDADEALADPPSLLPCEPVVGFSAYRITGSADDDILIRFKYVAVFRQDGGFVSDSSAGCSGLLLNDHEGDTEPFAIDVRVKRTDAWRASFVKLISRCSNPQMAATRPVLYLSAGKHHFYCSPGVSLAEVTGGPDCIDNHRGNGVVRIPSALFWVPQSFVLQPDGQLANVCHFGATGARLNSTRLQRRDLGNLGFPGETLFQSFYDPSVQPIAAALEPDGAYTVDADGDGLAERWEVDFADNINAAPLDPCVLDATNPPDADGDDLAGKCDSDLNFRQKYVGIGEPGFPPVPPPAPQWGAQPIWGGFWDSDQDGSPNGIDQCPSLKPFGSATLANRWAEDVNWPPHPTNNNELGFFQRGGTCDPYPVSLSTWKAIKKAGSVACGPPQLVTGGADTVSVATSASRGASANDPFWDAPGADPQAVWIGQRHRCACRDKDTGTPLIGTACVLNAQSECFRSDVRAATATQAVGRGWRPIDRPGCARDSDSWCAKQLLPVPRFDVASNQTSWSWKTELDAFGPLALTPHYASEDVTQVPNSPPFQTAHVRLNHEYALWSLIDLEQAPAIATQRPDSFFPDPEYDPLGRGAILFNVQSAQSLRLRSVLHEQPKTSLASVHTVLTPGLNCVLLDLSQLLAQVELWFGPDPVQPESASFAGLRAVAHDGELARAVVLRPAEGNYAGLVLGDTLLDHWAASVPVALAPLRAPRRAGAPAPPGDAIDDGIPLDTEPELLVLERSAIGDTQRWARLAPAASTGTTLRYELRAEGVLRGALSTEATLVSDAAGGGAAAVDFDSGMVEALIYGDDPPARHVLPAELTGRSGAALALRGHQLLVAGGVRAGVLASDLWLVDLHTGQSARLRDDLPPRRGARLFVTPSGAHVHLAGGFDTAGARHDDVWQLANFRELPGNAKPQRLYADTSARGAFEARTRPLIYDEFGGALLQVAFDVDSPRGATVLGRTAFGWELLGDEGAPMACPAADANGGRLCSLSPAWWSSPGRVPCDGGACGGSAGSLEHVQTLGPPATAAAPDESGVWVLRTKHLERWLPGPNGALTSASSVTLPKTGQDVAARLRRALVATLDGVLLASETNGGLALSPVLELCGAPYRVVPVGEDVWAVATTLGLALVSDAEGVLRIESMSLFSPHAGGTLLPLPIDPGGEPACTLAKKQQAPGALLGPKSALADAGQARLLFATDHLLFDLDVRDPTAPALRSMLPLAHPVSGLRADLTQRRAYGVSVVPSHRPVFDLRGPAATLAGAHDVTPWVRRRDAGRYRVRQTGGWIEAAEVIP